MVGGDVQHDCSRHDDVGRVDDVIAASEFLAHLADDLPHAQLVALVDQQAHDLLEGLTDDLLRDGRCGAHVCRDMTTRVGQWHR